MKYVCVPTLFHVIANKVIKPQNFYILYLLSHRIPIAGFILAVVMVLVSAGAATGISARDDLGFAVGTVRVPNSNQ